MDETLRVDLSGAPAEIARVLRPGGGLGLIWNEDDQGLRRDGA